MQAKQLLVGANCIAEFWFLLCFIWD